MAETKIKKSYFLYLDYKMLLLYIVAYLVL